MPTTPFGLRYPETFDPVDVPESIRQLAMSTDTYLTPVTETVPARTDLTFGSPAQPVYVGSFNVTRVGPMYFLYGGVRRMDGASGAWATFTKVATAVNPELRPPSTVVVSASPAYVNSSTIPLFQYQYTPAGEIQLRQTAPTTTTHTLFFSTIWTRA